ncbi:MAG: type II toxin-antitoxin system RelE/ParE family toxin [Lachnospiraceae bacterium]|nr:type II toxin-antitoxin system RelE/ParE family toxin [Lachnospiraceae bacterium]
MEYRQYKFEFTKLAETDIDETISYICEELHNSEAASSFVEELEEKLDEVCKNPKIGRLVENEFLRLDNVRRFLVKNYVAYYIVDDDSYRVVVLRVVYGKRDQIEIIKNL